MLQIQKYIQENGLSSLKEFGIKLNFHDSDERVILNYNQLESPKLNEIVREARGLTLNRYTGELIARSFRRFFNWGEGTPEEMSQFDWSNCWTNEKVDGSIISYFYWNNQWHIQTRNSYGSGIVNDSDYTWKQIFDLALEGINLEPVIGRTYIFELCSPYNQVVQIYQKPILYLLSIFEGEQEWSHAQTNELAESYGLLRPLSVYCNNPTDVNLEVERQSKIDDRFEGLVCRDILNNRYKFKSPLYLRLSHLANNGNLCNIKHLVPIILNGEQDEMIAYFPYIKDRLRKVDEIIQDLFKELDNNWLVYHDQKSRKKFALGVQRCPLNGILFSVFGKSYDEVNLWEELRKNQKNIIEHIKGKLNEN